MTFEVFLVETEHGNEGYSALLLLVLKESQKLFILQLR
jgi:hypothetical protein